MYFVERMRLATLLILLVHFQFSFGYYGYPPPTTHRHIFETKTASKSSLPSKISDKDDCDEIDSIGETKKKPTEPMTLVEFAEKERQASRRLTNKLLLPERIGKAANATLYAFVILGFLLNLFGYAYVRNPDGSLTIGTMETRRFQEEINRTVKSDVRKGNPNQE